MKIIHYIKMAWVQARTEKVYTGLYIGGVALAVIMTMLLSTVLYVKIGPVYPEYNRSNTNYLSSVRVYSSESKSTIGWCIGTELLRNHIYRLQNMEDIGVFIDDSYSTRYVQPGNNTPDINVILKPCDDGFFRIYEFDILAGRVLNTDDLKTDQCAAIITETLAKRVFGSPAEALDRDLSMDYTKYRVIGVVRDASSLTPNSFADVYIPYTAFPEHREWKSTGGFEAVIKIKDEAQHKALVEEVAELTRTYNDNPGEELIIENQPSNHVIKALIPFNRDSDSMSLWHALKYYLLAVLALLLIPALNLSGMISGRMDSRTGEIGIRKAFGAPRGSLINQVLVENLIFTLAGALIGLAATWIIIITGKSWVFSLLDEFDRISQYGLTVSADMLFSPTLFLIVLAVTLVLNLLSALIPAVRAMRHSIVSSLNEKR